MVREVGGQEPSILLGVRGSAIGTTHQGSVARSTTGGP